MTEFLFDRFCSECSTLTKGTLDDIFMLFPRLTFDQQLGYAEKFKSVKYTEFVSRYAADVGVHPMLMTSLSWIMNFYVTVETNARNGLSGMSRIEMIMVHMKSECMVK